MLGCVCRGACWCVCVGVHVGVCGGRVGLRPISVFDSQPTPDTIGHRLPRRSSLTSTLTAQTD